MTRVVTQTQPERWLLDDVRLHLVDAAGEHRVAAEVKSSASFLTSPDAAAAVAELWARDPSCEASLRLAALAVTCTNERVMGAFFDAAATFRATHLQAFRRLLRFGLNHVHEVDDDGQAELRAAVRRIETGEPDPEVRSTPESRREVRAARRTVAIDAFVTNDSPQVDPVSPGPDQCSRWLAPITRWIRSASRDADIDRIALGIDSNLRARLAAELTVARAHDASLRRGRVAEAALRGDLPPGDSTA